MGVVINNNYDIDTSYIVIALLPIYNGISILIIVCRIV